MELTFGLNEKATFYLNTALLGTIFSAFALIGDSRFVIFGISTILYGITGHAVNQFLYTIFKEKANTAIISIEFVILVVWVAFSISIFSAGWGSGMNSILLNI